MPETTFCYMNGTSRKECVVDGCPIYPCTPGKAQKYLTQSGVKKKEANKYKWNILKNIAESKIVFTFPDKIIITMKYENDTFFATIEEK